MEELLKYFTIIPLPFENTVEAHAQIENYSRRMGIAMGKNDVWIAVTAHTTGARLLTTQRTSITCTVSFWSGTGLIP